MEENQNADSFLESNKESDKKVEKTNTNKSMNLVGFFVVKRFEVSLIDIFKGVALFITVCAVGVLCHKVSSGVGPRSNLAWPTQSLSAEDSNLFKIGSRGCWLSKKKDKVQVQDRVEVQVQTRDEVLKKISSEPRFTWSLIYFIGVQIFEQNRLVLLPPPQSESESESESENGSENDPKYDVSENDLSQNANGYHQAPANPFDDRLEQQPRNNWAIINKIR
jgi:hypothetical protein